MSTPTPHDDEHAALHEALRRDAARLPEPRFDAALHHTMIRRIRALSGANAERWQWMSRPVLAGAAVMVALAVFIVVRLPRSPERQAQLAQPDIAAVIASTQAAVASLSPEASSPLPAWMSPTASLLDPPAFPSMPTLHQP